MDLMERSKKLNHMGKIKHNCFGQAEECGEQISVYLQFDKGTGNIADVGFDGANMSFVLRAGMDIVFDHVKGKSLDELKKMDEPALLSASGLDQLDITKRKVLMLGFRALKNALSSCKG